MTLLEAVDLVRELLSDYGGDREVPWAIDDSACDASNAKLVRYLDEARAEYRLRHPLRDDSTVEVVRPTVTAAAAGHLPLHVSVLWLCAVRLADLTLLPFAAADDLERRAGDWLALTGEPECWTYVDERAARLVPAPVVDTPLRLVVDRLPIGELSWAQRDQAIADVPEGEQQALVFYAAKRALETRRNAGDIGLAQMHGMAFERLAGARPTSQQLAVRRRLAAGPVRTRSIQIRGLA